MDDYYKKNKAGNCPCCRKGGMVQHYFYRNPDAKRRTEYETQVGQADFSCWDLECLWSADVIDLLQVELDFILFGTGIEGDPMQGDDKDKYIYENIHHDMKGGN